MAYWSVYITSEDEKYLKKSIEKVAKTRNWSFSQAITGLLKEYFSKKQFKDEDLWTHLTSESFFKGYSKKDEIYDSL